MHFAPPALLQAIAMQRLYEFRFFKAVLHFFQYGHSSVSTIHTHHITNKSIAITVASF